MRVHQIADIDHAEPPTRAAPDIETQRFLWASTGFLDGLAAHADTGE